MWDATLHPETRKPPEILPVGAELPGGSLHQDTAQDVGCGGTGLNAGRRTDFGDKKSSDFSGEIFRERNYCPRTAFSGSNSCSILSHPVMS